MSVFKFWMIVDVSGNRPTDCRDEARLIPTDQSNVMYMDEDVAKSGLIRLKTMSPAREFVLMEAVSVAVPYRPVVTYTIQPIDEPMPF